MQDTYTRLIQAMELQFGRPVGPTFVADTLKIKTAQVVKNWEDRGVSKDGILRAHRYAGINPGFIETGDGEPLVSSATSASAVFDDGHCPPMDCRWPFQGINAQQWSALPERTRGYIEGVVATMMGGIEQSRQGAFQARA